MTYQTHMFPTAPHNHTETSVAAARRVLPRVGTDKERVLAYLYGRRVTPIEYGSTVGASRARIAADLGMPLATVCARVNELIKEGLCYEEGTESYGSHRPGKIVRAR